jgi:hypothetical protein
MERKVRFLLAGVAVDEKWYDETFYRQERACVRCGLVQFREVRRGPDA